MPNDVKILEEIAEKLQPYSPDDWEYERRTKQISSDLRRDSYRFKITSPTGAKVKLIFGVESFADNKNDRGGISSNAYFKIKVDGKTLFQSASYSPRELRTVNDAISVHAYKLDDLLKTVYTKWQEFGSKMQAQGMLKL